MDIIFSVNHQTITRQDTQRLASGSQNYVKAKFTFSDEWKNLTKTAIFKKGTNAYQVLLTQDSCTVPAEVLASEGSFSVSVFGGSLITVTTCEVYVSASGYTSGGAPADPTPSVYNQIIALIEGIDGSIDEALEEDY